MNKNWTLMILTLALILSLAACKTPAEGAGNNLANPSNNPGSSVTTPPSSVPQQPQGSGTPADAPGGAPAAPAPSPADPTPAQGGETLPQPRVAFRAALEKLYTEQLLPSGDKLQMAEYSDISKAQFAILDVDQDGEEELVFTFSDTYTAGMATYVYAYNAELDRLMVELWEFPSLSFYNTGIVEALASHNHGPAGDALWPFILYQYEPMADDYRKVAVVDAWDSNLVGDTYDGKTFPTQADADGDGVVYYVMYDGYALENPMDGPAFRDWYNSWFVGAEEVSIPYQYLTEENIQSIG